MPERQVINDWISQGKLSLDSDARPQGTFKHDSKILTKRVDVSLGRSRDVVRSQQLGRRPQHLAPAPLLRLPNPHQAEVGELHLSSAWFLEMYAAQSRYLNRK